MIDGGTEIETDEADLGYAILIISDSREIQNRIRDVIKTAAIACQLYETANGIEGIKILLNNKIDLVLCDLATAGIDGYRFLAMLREKEEFREIPIVVLIENQGAETKAKALSAGAADYLASPFIDSELITRIQIHLKNKSLRDEVKEKNAKLEELSNIDGLTKVLNRRRLLEMVEWEFLRADRYRSNLAFIMCDIDKFALVNDALGQLTGDRALLATANLIRDGLRVNDTLGRYDGDKFGIILPETDLQGATVVAKRYRSQLEELILQRERTRLSLTASFGVVCFPHKEIVVAHDLVKKADKALSIAKAGGGNRVVILE
ncbi:MAG: diguanylate cyclase [Deltaproteobacteria bacterium]|nr:diguanylate cyclase [Deltaproteobacteria bacterium]